MIEFTQDDLQAFAPRPAGPAGEIWDGYVEALVANGGELCASVGIDQPLELQHFLAQIAHESGGFSLLWENMNYSAERLMQVFGAGRHSAMIGDEEAAALAHHPEQIAERVYGLGNPRKAAELGNTQPGDGYAFRGFGPMQITGRTAHERYLQGDTSYYGALRSAFLEWDEKHCNPLAQADDIKTITKRINGGYNGLDSRKAWLLKAKRIWRDLPGDDNDYRAPPASMLQSSTGNTSVALGGGGGINTANEVSTAIAVASRARGGFSMTEFVIALASSPTFWVGVATMIGAAYIWLERKRKLDKHGI